MPGPADSVKITLPSCGLAWPPKLGRDSPWELRLTKPFLAQSPLEMRQTLLFSSSASLGVPRPPERPYPAPLHCSSG